MDPFAADDNYIVDEHGVRRRQYVPMSERQGENYRCRFCTFIARDQKRLSCHERSHGMPPTKRERFKCMFCPQGFDSELKFRLHITCHPGLIKLLLYKCKKCEFDSNQKHSIIRHITCNRDRKHRGVGPVEDQYSVVSRTLETRVLQCEQCNYMTRHKIHMAIHYREHGILRDKSEFNICGLTPHDIPLSSYEANDMSVIANHVTPDSTPRSTPSPRNFPHSPDTPMDMSFDFQRPSSTAPKRVRTVDPSLMSVNEIAARNDNFNRMVTQQAARQPSKQVIENSVRKFKCPICRYLLPKAADLKNHVKRHSEMGQITLVMFRCKYCSCMSTAQKLVYVHQGEKHPGKPIALVKKIVAIDTTDVDKSFAETSVEETFEELEENIQKELANPADSNDPFDQDTSDTETVVKSEPSSSNGHEQLFVIPEGVDTFNVPLQCPKCSFSTYKKREIVEHVATHPEIKIVSSDPDVQRLVSAGPKRRDRSPRSSPAAAHSGPLPSQEQVLIVPDEQNFKEPALCSRCSFQTMQRKEMVLHLQQNHPEISVIGRNSYHIQVSCWLHSKKIIRI